MEGEWERNVKGEMAFELAAFFSELQTRPLQAFELEVPFMFERFVSSRLDMRCRPSAPFLGVRSSIQMIANGKTATAEMAPVQVLFATAEVVPSPEWGDSSTAATSVPVEKMPNIPFVVQHASVDRLSVYRLVCHPSVVRRGLGTASSRLFVVELGLAHLEEVTGVLIGREYTWISGSEMQGDGLPEYVASPDVDRVKHIFVQLLAQWSQNPLTPLDAAHTHTQTTAVAALSIEDIISHSSSLSSLDS